MAFARPGPSAIRHVRRPTLIVGGVLALPAAILAIVLLATGTASSPSARQRSTASATTGAGAAPNASAATTIAATPPPAGLPVIDYGPVPAGFPADPAHLSTVRLREGLRPTDRIGAYDRPGGRPLAFLAPTIRGVEVTMPIVDRRSGWAAVLLPSANRTIAWVPPGSWTTVPLPDQIIVVRATHQLIWLRDDAVIRSWRVTLGHRDTPTPLGRTFILGRSSQPGRVYAGTDVFALGAVPDAPSAVPAGLRGAHIGIHAWYHDGTLGQNVSDGCVRLTRNGQRELLAQIAPGTEVVIVDTYGKRNVSVKHP